MIGHPGEVTPPEPPVRPSLRDSRPAYRHNGPVLILGIVVGVLMLAACLVGVFVAGGVTR